MTCRLESRQIAADSARTARQSQRSALTLVEVLVIVGLIVVVIALLLPSVRSTREPARRSSCLNNLKQISLGLQSYVTAHGEFPPAYTTDAEGKPLHSWRTLILPFMEHQALFKSIDLTKPWDDPANAKALAAMPDVYDCPSAAKNATNYLAIVTPASCIQATEPRKLSDIKDEHDATLTIIEVDDDRAVPWMAPSDADERLVLSLTDPATRMPHAQVLAAFVDGHARPLPREKSDTLYRELISIAGNDPVDSPAAE